MPPPTASSLGCYCVLPHSSRGHPSVLEVYEKELVLETTSIANTSLGSSSGEGGARRYSFDTVLSPMHDVNGKVLTDLFEGVSQRRNVSLLFASAPPPTTTTLMGGGGSHNDASPSVDAILANQGEAVAVHLQLLSGLLPSLITAACAASGDVAGRHCTATLFEVCVPPTAAVNGSNGAIHSLVARDLFYNPMPPAMGMMSNNNGGTDGDGGQSLLRPQPLPYSIVNSLTALSEVEFSASASGGNEAVETLWGEVMDVFRLERLATSHKNANRQQQQQHRQQQQRSFLSSSDRTVSDPSRTALFMVVRLNQWSSILIGDLGSNAQLLHLCGLAMQQDVSLYGRNGALRAPKGSMLTDTLTPFFTASSSNAAGGSSSASDPLRPTAPPMWAYDASIVCVPNVVTRMAESVRQLGFAAKLVDARNRYANALSGGSGGGDMGYGAPNGLTAAYTTRDYYDAVNASSSAAGSPTASRAGGSSNRSAAGLDIEIMRANQSSIAGPNHQMQTQQHAHQPTLMQQEGEPARNPTAAAAPTIPSSRAPAVPLPSAQGLQEILQQSNASVHTSQRGAAEFPASKPPPPPLPQPTTTAAVAAGVQQQNQQHRPLPSTAVPIPADAVSAKPVVMAVVPPPHTVQQPRLPDGTVPVTQHYTFDTSGVSNATILSNNNRAGLNKSTHDSIHNGSRMEEGGKATGMGMGGAPSYAAAPSAAGDGGGLGATFVPSNSGAVNGTAVSLLGAATNAANDWRSELLVDYRIEDERRRSNGIRMGLQYAADGSVVDETSSASAPTAAAKAMSGKKNLLEQLASEASPERRDNGTAGGGASPTLGAFARMNNTANAGTLNQQHDAFAPAPFAVVPPSAPVVGKGNSAATASGAPAAGGYSSTRHATVPAVVPSQRRSPSPMNHNNHNQQQHLAPPSGMNKTPNNNSSARQGGGGGGSFPRSQLEMSGATNNTSASQQQQHVRWESVSSSREGSEGEVGGRGGGPSPSVAAAQQQLQASVAVNNDLQGVIRQLRDQLAYTTKKLHVHESSTSDATPKASFAARPRSPSPSLQRKSPAVGRTTSNNTPRKIIQPRGEEPNHRHAKGKDRAGAGASGGDSSSGSANEKESPPSLIDLTNLIDTLYGRIGDMEVMYDRDLKTLRSVQKENSLLSQENALLTDKATELERILKDMKKKDTIRIRQNALNRIYKVAGANANATGDADAPADEDLGDDVDQRPTNIFEQQRVAMRDKLVKEQEEELKVLRRRVANLENDNKTLRRKCGLHVGEYTITNGKPMASNAAVAAAASGRSPSASRHGRGASVGRPTTAAAELTGGKTLFDAISHNLGVQTEEGQRISAFIESERKAMREAVDKTQGQLALVVKERDDLQRLLKAGPSAPSASDHIQAVAGSLLAGCQTMVANLNAAEARLKERAFVASLNNPNASNPAHGGRTAASLASSTASIHTNTSLSSSSSPALLSIVQHRDAIARLESSVRDVMNRTSSGATRGLGTASSGGASADDADVLSYYLNFEVERLQSLKSFVPTYTQLCAGVDQLKRFA